MSAEKLSHEKILELKFEGIIVLWCGEPKPNELIGKAAKLATMDIGAPPDNWPCCYEEIRFFFADYFIHARCEGGQWIGLKWLHSALSGGVESPVHLRNDRKRFGQDALTDQRLSLTEYRANGHTYTWRLALETKTGNPT